MLSYVGITEARDRGGVREPPGDSGSTRLAPGVGPGSRGSPRPAPGPGPGSTLTAPGPGRGSTHFLLPQTVAFIGIEIDLDRPRFAPSFFATSRVATPYSRVFCACFSVIPLARRQK